MSQFQIDLAAARSSEQLVLDVLKKKIDELPATVPEAWIHLENVGDNPAYFHKGDILALDELGRETMIEVKNDSCIARTHNVLCEEANYFFWTGERVPGNMYSDYEIYCVVSEQERKIYVLDFKIMKKIYKTGIYTEIQHSENISYSYLLPLSRLERQGGILYILDY